MEGRDGGTAESLGVARHNHATSGGVGRGRSYRILEVLTGGLDCLPDDVAIDRCNIE